MAVSRAAHHGFLHCSPRLDEEEHFRVLAQEMGVQSLGREGPREKELATHSSVLGIPINSVRGFPFHTLSSIYCL